MQLDEAKEILKDNGYIINENNLLKVDKIRRKHAIDAVKYYILYELNRKYGESNNSVIQNYIASSLDEQIEDKLQALIDNAIYQIER